jgi:hypothetical protein
VPAPATADELGAALGERLYVEGEVVVEDDRVLALTDDDEVELAYFFLSPQAAEQAPERLTYLRYEDFPLPRGVNAEAGAFAAPIEVGTLAPAGDGEGTTYAVLRTFDDGDSIGWLPTVSRIALARRSPGRIRPPTRRRWRSWPRSPRTRSATRS